MIAIIDNGGAYSDHSIYFIDLGDADPERVMPLLLPKLAAHGEEARLLGLSPSIAWRDGSATEPLDSYWCSGAHHADVVFDGGKFRHWGPTTCPAFLAHAGKSEPGGRHDLDAYRHPWTPEECPCTCDAGKLYEAAHRSEG